MDTITTFISETGTLNVVFNVNDNNYILKTNQKNVEATSNASLFDVGVTLKVIVKDWQLIFSHTITRPASFNTQTLRTIWGELAKKRMERR